MSTEIQYGRISYEGKKCGYATWNNEAGQKVELINVPYGELILMADGVREKTSELAVIIWTKVAGWLGMDELRGGLGL